ncbi:HAD family phosphatase [Roseimicrobium sp. ORNL1]|uniref:HAD family hydrolase n=1 Tax=Roseimicrobium sp. ORNL1 TaxID=2711231 RepID=UPI0013E1A98C|nr:HAD family phosphatase [Roseimicrobium sp. ORNL1]QIF00559.1 HAD family phosphatase [Roseimicrobium sp. ORNL1]
MSRALLFDIGNVLVRFDFSPAAQKFATLSKATAQEVLSLLAPFKDDLESGRIADDDFIAQSVERIGFRGTREDFVQIWGDIFTANDPMIARVKQLSGQMPLYLFSNTSGLHKAWLFEKFDVFGLFAGGIYSHEARCMKPHEPIFHEAINVFGLEPERTLYIDDLPDNIATGRRLGFQCHQYHPDRHEEFEPALTAFEQRV